ncbi:MAG: methyltransferase domain-containing protein [Microcoleaceae cyanobacterium]
MIKNEEDILETFIRHNLNYLDFLILADNSSTDSSRIIIKNLMQEGLNLCVIDDNKMAYTQTNKITNLYRRVATSFFPEFIVPIDADELIQSPSKQSFINSLQAIPKNGIGIYPWKTYIPEPTTSNYLPSNFKYRRKIEQPQYLKIILRTNGRVNYQLKISQGSHGIISESGDISSVELSDICLAHFPIRNVNQLLKKMLLGWLGYVDRYKSMDSEGQGYQKKDLYMKIMQGEKFSDSDLTYIALNYAQKVEVKEDWLNNVELEPPTIKLPQLSFPDLTLKNDDHTNVITTIIKSWENQILNNPSLISREDLIFFTQSPTSPSTENSQHGIFEPNFHLEKLFIDIPPFKYIYERFLPESILDIGCGLGQYLKIFNKLGAEEIIGVDGFTPEQSFLNPNQYIRHDLTNPLNLKRKFDLVMCLEVAEHLPPGNEVNLIEILNHHTSNILIFSAAEIGQPGHGHINCQSFKYWANLLQNQGWLPMVAETLFFRCISSFSWFRRNPVVLQKKQELIS